MGNAGDVQPPQELQAWQAPSPSVTGSIHAALWQAGSDSQFQRAAEIVAAAATEAAAAAAAAVVAAAGHKIREQIDALQSQPGGRPTNDKGAIEGVRLLALANVLLA